MQNAGSQRVTWLVIFAALSASTILYGIVVALFGLMLSPRPPGADASGLRFVMSAAGAVALFASMVWMQVRTAGKIGDAQGRSSSAPLMNSSRFQSVSLVALALSEMCAVVGLLWFFIGRVSLDFWPFLVGTLLVNFAFILPRGLRYWKNLEASEVETL